MAAVWKVLLRRKIIQQTEETSLGRVLSTWDLTFLGVGATLGIGLYVLVGKVARETAGPSIVLSFLIAAIASAFAGLCYAEFGARVPRAGSAYVYSYVCIGEIVAFIIGWNLILEYVIGSASVAHGMSLYVDTMTNDTLKGHFASIAPIHVSFLAEYFDFFAFGVSIILSIGLAVGVKESSWLNNIVTLLNIVVVIFVIIAGSFKARWSNWNIPSSTMEQIGKGGFFPFGLTGMIKGAATCFYGFVGFDCIATTGEEARNPRKSIPIAILASLSISLVAYCGTSVVITMMVPYYNQDVDSPIPFAFDVYGMTVMKWIVSLGGVFALASSLFGAMFPLPRIIYAMSSDGLIFRFLGMVNARFATPMIGTILAGILTGILGGLFKQGQLIDMMSIGTLLAYTIVAACVLILRYSVSICKVNIHPDYEDTSDGAHTLGQIRGWFSILMNRRSTNHPTKRSEFIVTLQVGLFCVLSVLSGLCANFLPDEIGKGEAYAIVLTSVVVVCLILLMISICLQPQNDTSLTFKVPFVPLIPCLSILVNIYLMMALDVATWIRFGVWMAIGLPIYCCSVRPFGESQTKTMPIGCSGKNRNMSEGSTYVNFGYLHGETDENHVANGGGVISLERHSNGVREQQKDAKHSADSDSGAFFEENEQDQDEEHAYNRELEIEKEADTINEVLLKYASVMMVQKPECIESKSVQDALVTLDNMLEKEEEKCADCGPLGAPAFRNRSVSIVSSVSNNSNNLPMEVSVVAIIHHEDDRAPIMEESETPEDPEVETPLIIEEVVQTPSSESAEIVEARTFEFAKKETGTDTQEEMLIFKKEEEFVNPPTPLLPLPLHSSSPPPPPLPLSTPVPAVVPIIDGLSTEIPSLSPLLRRDDDHSHVDLSLPPPPPSMSQFELFKTEPRNFNQPDFALARATLKKSARPITPPSPESSTSLNTPYEPKRRLIVSQSEMNFYNPSEDNIKLTSQNIKQFKDKLAAELGHIPTNIKFSAFPAHYYSLDCPLTTSRTTANANRNIGHQDIIERRSEQDLEASGGLSPPKSEIQRKNSGVVDKSLKEINKAAIKARLSELYTNRGFIDSGIATLHYKSRKKPTEGTEEHHRDDFGETKA